MDLFNLKKVKALEQRTKDAEDSAAKALETVEAISSQTLQVLKRMTITGGLNYPSGIEINSTFYPSADNSNNVLNYVSNVDVFSVVSKIAETTATVPLYVYRKTQDKKSFSRYMQTKDESLLKTIYRVKALEELPESDPFYELLANPNSYQTQREFILLAMVLYLLNGEVFIYKMKTGVERGSKTVSMHIFTAADTALTITGAFPYEVKSYTFSYNGREVLKGIPPVDVIHIKTPNPKYTTTGEHLRGLSPLKAGKKTIDRLDTAQDRGTSVLKNGGVPGIMYLESLDGNEPDSPTYSKWKNDLQQWINSDDNAGAPMPMAGKVGYHQIGLKMADIELMGLQNMDFKKLCNLYKISTVLFNSEAAATESNVQEMVKLMYTNACMPLADAFTEGLNRGLIQDNTKFIAFDFSGVPALQADMLKMMNTISAMPVSLTGNQIWEIMGYEKSLLPEMEKPLMKQGYTFIDETGTLPPPGDGLNP